MNTQFYRLFSMALLSAGISVAAQAQSISSFINLPNAPIGIAANPVTNNIYVVEPSYGLVSDSLEIINGSSDSITSQVAVPVGASFVTVNYFTNTIYVAGCNYNLNPSPCVVTVINGKTNAVVKSIPVTSSPGLGLTGITVNPITRFVYVANGNDNEIDIINGCTNKLAGSIALNGNAPVAIAMNPIVDRLYVTYGTNQTSVLDAVKKTILSTTIFGFSTVGAAVDLATGHVFVTDDESGPSQTGVLDQKGKVLASVTVDDSPLGVDVDPLTNLAFVAANAIDTVDVLNGSNNTLQARVTGVPATYLAVNAATEKVYVSGRTGVTVLTEK